MAKQIDTMSGAHPGEMAGFSKSIWFRERGTQISLCIFKTNIPKIRKVLFRLAEPYHSSYYVATIQNLARDPTHGLYRSWRSTLAWAMRSGAMVVVFGVQSNPLWTPLVQSRMGLLIVLWLSHQTLTRLPAGLPVPGKESVRRVAGSQEPGACVSNL